MPLGARHGHLDHAPWVMQHLLPFDEATLEQALRLPPGQVEAFLYDDHHTLAQLAAARGVAFRDLVTRLSAWAPAEQAERIRQRVRLVLVSGHLAQHVVAHVFHGSAYSDVLIAASGLNAAAWHRKREQGWSYARLARAGGHEPLTVEADLRTRIASRQEAGVRAGDTPASQAMRMTGRQHGLLHCWMTRPTQHLDAAAPYGRAYLLHRPGHRASDVPRTRAEQRIEEAAIERGRVGRPPSCWPVPDAFVGDPGEPLARGRLRALAGLLAAETPEHPMHELMSHGPSAHHEASS